MTIKGCHFEWGKHAPRYWPIILSVFMWLFFFLSCFISYYYTLIVQNNGFHCDIFTYNVKVLWIYPLLFFLVLSSRLFEFVLFFNSSFSTLLLSLSAVLKFHTWVKSEILSFPAVAYFTKHNDFKFCPFFFLHVMWR